MFCVWTKLNELGHIFETEENDTVEISESNSIKIATNGNTIVLTFVDSFQNTTFSSLSSINKIWNTELVHFLKCEILEEIVAGH